MSEQAEIIRKMLLIRLVEEEIVARYGKQQMRCPVHLSIGQEAIAVGVCHNLRPSDKVFSTHRCHAHYLAKGGSTERMTLELYGKVGGCLDGRGGSMHLCDGSVGMVASVPIVGSAIPLAVGAALANKLDGKDDIVVCFFGDGAVEEGVFHESLNFASLMKLPIIFVCENNEYSIDTHIKKRQPWRSIDKLAYGHDIRKFITLDADVFALADCFSYAIDEARKNEPVFVCVNTQRFYVHCGTDLNAENARCADPMIKIPANHDIATAPILAEIKAAFDAAEAAPLPTPDMASRYMYAE